VRHHNPITQQLIIVGKRREAAEAMLALRIRKTGHQDAANPVDEKDTDDSAQSRLFDGP
jgi:hypothetical protein